MRMSFYCRGCEMKHQVNDIHWRWSRDRVKPTVTPSILVTGTVPLTDEEIDLVMAGTPVKVQPLRCHSYITDGKIIYLSDCSHHLADQVVDLEGLEYCDL